MEDLDGSDTVNLTQPLYTRRLYKHRKLHPALPILQYSRALRDQETPDLAHREDWWTGAQRF